jgi:hypothetical protein
MFSCDDSNDNVTGCPAQNILIVEAFAKFLLSLIGDTSKFLQVIDGKRSFDVSFLTQNCQNVEVRKQKLRSRSFFNID